MEWLVDFNAEKTQYVMFGQCNNPGAIDVKIDGSVLEEKLPFKMLGLSLLNCVGAPTLLTPLKLPSGNVKF